MDNEKKFTKWIIIGFIYSILVLMVIANTAHTKPNFYVMLLVSYWVTFFFVFVGSILLIFKKYKPAMIFWIIGGISSLPLGILIIAGSGRIRAYLKDRM